jgi:hypothetical protein
VEVQNMVLEIECSECGIARVIHDNPQYIEELAEMHAEEYGHAVSLEEADDD